MDDPVLDDPVLQALRPLMPAGVRRGELDRDGRVIRWVESGQGEPVVVLDAAAAEPGSLAWAGIMPLVAAHTRVAAYDRAGIGDSDPLVPLTLDGQLGDLAAVIRAASPGRPAIVAGHSWGGLLAQLLALDHPELIGGLVLLDPADEVFLDPPDEGLRDGLAMGEAVLAHYASGELPATVRGTFRSYAERPTGDDQVRELILDAYAWSFRKRSQAVMVRDEHQLIAGSLPEIARRRAACPPLAMPVVLFSATTGQARDERDRYTACHAALVASLPAGRHVVLDDTTHAMNQERPAEVAGAIISLLGPAPQAAL